MMDWSERERAILGELEKDLGGAELSAVLSEWIVSMIHRVTAVTLVLGWWRTQMTMQGFEHETVESSVPLILDRLWTSPKGQMIPLDQILDVINIHFDDTHRHDDEGEEGD
jgi:hypothetical protein